MYKAEQADPSKGQDTNLPKASLNQIDPFQNQEEQEEHKIAWDWRLLDELLQAETPRGGQLQHHLLRGRSLPVLRRLH